MPRRLAHWSLYCVAAPAAALELISVNSLFVGHPSVGALQAFGLATLLVLVPAHFLAPKERRHQFLARLLTAFSFFAILSLFVLRGKVAQVQAVGGSSAQIAFAPTLVVLLLQLGLATAYLLRSRRQPPRASRGGHGLPWWIWGPASLFVPLLLVAGFAGNALFGWDSAEKGAGSSSHGSNSNPEPGQEKYSRFPKLDDFAFAEETPRIGEDFGGQFIHYHTGQRPLIGISFSKRQWQRQVRISNDLRGIFDREAAVVGDQILLGMPDYVVTGLQAQVDEHVRAVRVRFALFDESGTILMDSYWSDWAGGFERGLAISEIGGTGSPAMGLTGTAGLVVNSLGLMIDRSAPAEALGARGVAR